jgi:hypothetical protein
VLTVDLSDPSVVSPGIAGFVTVFLLALAFLVLVRSMVGHLRRVRYQAEREAAEREAAPVGEAAEREAAPVGEAAERGSSKAPEPGVPGR